VRPPGCRAALDIGTHHKTGTVLTRNVFRDLGERLGLRFFSGWQHQLPEAADIWFMEYSRINPDDFPAIRGLHVIRHPLNIIFSGYRYHQICNEAGVLTLMLGPRRTVFRTAMTAFRIKSSFAHSRFTLASP